MNLTKAIEILDHETYLCTKPIEQDLKAAIRLSIEACEAILKARSLPNPPAFLWLPGETEE